LSNDKIIINKLKCGKVSKIKITPLALLLTISSGVVADYKVYGNSQVVDIPVPSGPQPTLGTNGFQLDANGVTISCDNAHPGDSGEVNGVTYTAVDNNTLGNFGYVNECTTHVTDMTSEFFNNPSYPNPDVGHWDVSNVLRMSSMFRGKPSFNRDLNDWDVSSVVYMDGIFMDSTSFNGDISNWEVTSLENATSMFRGASSFNGAIRNWDTSSVTSMQSMFMDATSFNNNIGIWDVSSVTNMTNMFRGASSFFRNISGWDVSAVGSYNFFDSGSPLRNYEPYQPNFE